MSNIVKFLTGFILLSHISFSPALAAPQVPRGAGDISAVLHCSDADATLPFVKAKDRNIVINDKPLALAGYTIYPIHANWRDKSFNTYLDQIMLMALHAGQNFVRPTDQWTKHDSTRDYTDPVIWEHLDHLVCAAQERGLYVLMDLSAYKWLLIAQGKDPMDARLWTDYLTAAGHHYSESHAIVEYSIVGEPEFPRTQADADRLVAYYRQLTDTLYAADPHHLVAAGGYNHMNDGIKNWWQPLFSLPHNDVGNFKVYSQHDIDLMPAVAAYGTKIHKPLILEETGMPQRVGDSAWSGEAYNNVKMSRADFLNLIYTKSRELGVSAVIVWNIACLLGPEHYDIYPGTPGAWAVMKAYGAISPPQDEPACPNTERK